MELPAPPYYPALGENEGGSKKNTSTYSNVADNLLLKIDVF